MVARLADGRDVDLDAVFQVLAHPIRRDVLEVLPGPERVERHAEGWSGILENLAAEL